MIIKRLSSATLQLPSSTGTLYGPVPADKRASLVIHLHNTSAVDQAFYLSWPGSADSQRRWAGLIKPGVSLLWEGKLPVVLEEGELITGYAGTADVVNVEITGSEEAA